MESINRSKGFFFSEEKKQKDFLSLWAVATALPHLHEERKFFGYFFQKSNV
jgi:hypothetical protein